MSYSGRYSVEELKLIATNELTLEEVDKQWAMFPLQEIETVIGSVVMLKNGQGQERNEPFTPAVEPVVEEVKAEEVVVEPVVEPIVETPSEVA